MKDEMQNFTTLIVDKVKEERLLATQGGPIILLQVFIVLLYCLLIVFIVVLVYSHSKTLTGTDRE